MNNYLSTAENYDITNRLKYLGEDLVNKILACAEIKTFESNTELVREGQYVKIIPFVLSGLVKVFTRFEDKELLLYYIKPEQSCIMSFSSAIHHDKSKIFAVTEQQSTVLMLPSDQVAKWTLEFPGINILFYNQYDLRYAEMIETINHLIYYKLDKRIFDYLKEKASITGKNPVKITHKEIANDLGTSREVVSRLVKKLENDKLLKQHHDSIEIFSV